MVPREQMEVRSQVQEAIAFYQTAGKEATLAEIDKPDGQFVRNEALSFRRQPGRKNARTSDKKGAYGQERY